MYKHNMKAEGLWWPSTAFFNFCSLDMSSGKICSRILKMQNAFLAKKLFLKVVASLPGTKEPFMRREATSRPGRRPDKASLLLIFVVN